jgi:hypothetical protein
MTPCHGSSITMDGVPKFIKFVRLKLGLSMHDLGIILLWPAVFWIMLQTIAINTGVGLTQLDMT